MLTVGREAVAYELVRVMPVAAVVVVCLIVAFFAYGWGQQNGGPR